MVGLLQQFQVEVVDCCEDGSESSSFDGPPSPLPRLLPPAPACSRHPDALITPSSDSKSPDSSRTLVVYPTTIPPGERQPHFNFITY